jgi:predicted Rossmann-fold nucleotide-binding protein
MPEFEGRYHENNVDKEIKTANYIERMFGLIDLADAFIIFDGGTGTLSEWTTAWLLAHLHYGNHKPLILYGEFWYEVINVIDKHFFIGEKETQVYKIVKDEKEMIQALSEFEQELGKRRGLSRSEDKEA